MKRSITKELALIISLIYGSILFVIVKKIDIYSMSNYLIILNNIIFITLCFKLIIFKLSKIRLISFPVIFLIFTYIFHFSQIFLLVNNYDFGSLTYSIVMNRLGTESFVEALKLSIYSSYCVFVGILIGSLKNNIKIFNNNYNNDNRRELKFGMILILIALPVDFFCIVLPQMIQMLTSGYLAVHEVEVSFIIRCISYLLLPGVYLVIKSDLVKKRTAKKVIFIYLVYKLGSMMTGLRAYNLINIALILYLYYSEILMNKIKKRYIILILLLTVPLGNLINVIRDIRASGIELGEVFLNLFNLKNNIYFSLLSEFGITINVVTEVCKFSLEPKMGAQLFSGLISVIPGISYVFPNVDWASMTISDSLNLWKWGGSYIADFYFDFGRWGTIFCGVYGYLITKLSNKIDIAIKNKKYEIVAFYIPLLVEIMYSVRSTITKIPRTIIWYALIYLCIKFLVYCSVGKGKIKYVKREVKEQ